MRAIETLLPDNAPNDIEGLRRIDAADLARYTADPANPWWRRRACGQALTGRVPDKWVPDLLARIRDSDETTEVRTELLDVLGDRPELLPWLRDEYQPSKRSYGLTESVLKARARLGDRTVSRELARVAAEPWRRTRELGESGLDALVDRYGIEAVLADLDEDVATHRLARVRLRYHNDDDVTAALADESRTIAHFAQAAIAEPDRLRRYLPDAPTVEARLWVAYALHQRTEEVAEARAIYEALGNPRVEVDGLDEQVRRAIVHEYVPWCQPETDPRWRVEAICTEPPAPVDVADQLARAASALRAAGRTPGPAVHCGDVHQQGDGTYHQIEFEGGSLTVSTLGPFVRGDGDPAIRAALSSAGLRWIDDAAANTTVTGLCVYYFGARNPLEVDQLLFYWQD